MQLTQQEAQDQAIVQGVNTQNAKILRKWSCSKSRIGKG